MSGPTNTTFTTLKRDVTNYLERGSSPVTDQDVYAQIPRLVNLAERNIMQSLTLLGTLEVLVNSAGLAAGVSVIAKPDRWRQTASMWFGAGSDNNTRTPLYARAYEWCRSYWPDATQTGTPLYYADYGYQKVLIVPTPDATYPLEWNAYLQPEYLSESNQENFFSQYVPVLLLYETLLASAPYLKDDSRIPVWESRRDFQLATLDRQELGRILDRAARRDRP